MKPTRWLDVDDSEDGGLLFFNSKPYVGSLHWREKKEYAQIVGKHLIYYIKYSGDVYTPEEIAKIHFEGEQNGRINRIGLD